MVANRAKRANRANPRQDRNEQPVQNNFKQKNGRQSNNTIEFSFLTKPKKTKVEIIPRNLSQETMVSSLNNRNKHIIFAIGPAGSGKTLLATLHAIKMLKEGIVEKIVVTRPNIAVDDKDIGFLPGDITKKMSPWMMPVLDVFAEYFSPAEIVYMLENGILELCPIAYIRGRTFKNSVVIFDEAQNSTPNSMLSVLTRIGENSKMIVTGDLRQGDRGKFNGLYDFTQRFKHSKSIDVIHFGPNDVERHPVIKELIALYGEDMDV